MIKVDKERVLQAIRRDNLLMKAEVMEKVADTILEHTDPRLEQNVIEWCDGAAITDIWIGKYCINAIMSIRGDKDFIGALEAMNLYLQDEDAGIWRIWRARS